jgi:hypothetical protein
MLAEIETVSLAYFGAFMVCLVFLSGVYLKWQANQIAQRMASKPNTISPQPLVVKTVDEYATKQELKAVDEDLQELKQNIVSNGETRRKSIEGKVEDLRQEMKQDMANVATDVTDTKVSMGEFRGELKQINLALINMNTSLQHLHTQQAQHNKKHD